MDEVEMAQLDIIHSIALFSLQFERVLGLKDCGNYEAALVELEVMLTFKLPDSYRSRLYQLQAEVYMILKQYAKVRRAALASIHFEPNFTSEKLNNDSILMMEGPTSSMIEWWEFYTKIKEEKLRIWALKEIVIILVHYRGELKGHVSHLFSPKPPDRHLEKLLLELSSTNNWSEMAYLILGIFSVDSVFCGGAEDCTTKHISVVPLLNDYYGLPNLDDYCGLPKSRVDELAVAIIKGGSPVKHLSELYDQPPLHTSAAIAVRSGCFELYRLVARLYIQWGRFNTRNQQGLTVTEYLQRNGYEAFKQYQIFLSINTSLPAKIKDKTPIQKDFLPLMAKEAVDRKEYDNALKYYHEIVGSLDEHDATERARFFRNISLVYSFQEKYEKSLEFVDKSLSINPSFEKAYIRKAQVLEDLKRPHLACQVYLKGLPFSADPIKPLSQAVEHFENHGDQLKKSDFEECISLFQKVKSSLWDQVLCQAAKDSRWKSIKLIVLGPSNRPLAKEFDASTVSFSTLYETLKKEESLKKYCHLMLLELLKRGAKIHTLSKNYPEVFHILVKLVLFIESCDVLEYVLKRNPLIQSEEKDLLHTAVQNGDVESECCFKVVHILLQKGTDPKAKDSNGKIASHYIKKRFTITGSLLQIYMKDLEVKSESLEERGNEFFKNKNYNNACSYYTVAIVVLGQKKENTDLSGRLYVKRSECFIKLKEFSLALNDASVFFKKHPNSFKAHELMGKVYRYTNRATSYVHLYEAYKLLDWDMEDNIRQEIVQELCRLIFELKTHHIANMRIIDVIHACINLMKANEFAVAECIFEIIVLQDFSSRDMDVSCIDLSHFCSEKAIRYGGSGVFEEALLILLDSGADLRNLTVYEGDTYLHAASILACRNGYVRLLQYVVSRRALRLFEINLVDSNGKTALFRLINEPNSPHKYHSINFLEGFQGSDHNIYGPEKTLTKDVYLRIDDDKDIRKPPNKKVPNSTSAKKRSSKSPPTLPINPNTLKVNNACHPADPCSYCQKLYNCAVKKQISGADSDNVIQSLVELCQMNHQGKVHEELLSKSIDIIVEELDLQSDIPTCLLSMKTNVFLKIVLKLASTKKWECMHKSFEFYQQKNGRNVLEGFASKLTAADFLNSVVFKEHVETYGEILTCLINNGATMEKDPQLKKTALEVCLTKGEYRAIIVLLENGLDSSLLTLSPGDTPLHAAAEIALRKDIGYFELFEYLLKLHDSDSVKYSHLNISCVDKHKQTMSHVACRIKCSKHSLRLLKICHEKGVRSDIPDASGKIPYQYISNKPSDERIHYLTLISSEPRRTESPSTSVNSTPEMQCNFAASQEKSVSKMNSIKSEKKYSIRALLKDMIDGMDDHKCKELHIVSFYKDDKKRVAKYSSYRAEADVQNAGDLQRSSDGEDGEDDEEGENVDLLNSNTFDKLEWEVECTSDVWKTLHDKSMPYKKREQAILKIQLLARGDWHRTFYKKVKNMPPTLKLFTLKLSRTSRIVWELAITFSPRCSVMKSMDHNDVNLETLQGQVYTEVIRVWAVVFDLKDLKRVLDQIVKSHQRAETCHVQKQLESIHKVSSGDGTKRLPRLFAEKHIDKHQLDLQRFCPPVSDKDDEYHIIKFYSFSTALVSSVLQMETSQNVDFPFQVTELEHRIINLHSTAPIILLGRSGTGKTTCCVYRLWMKFVKYWTKADLADAPLYPSSFVQMRQPEVVVELPKTEDADADDVDEETDELSTAENQSNTLEEESTPNSSDSKNGPGYIHLHQMFVTKNGVLCNEVHKNFQELRHGNEIASKYKLEEDFTLPPTFKEITDSHFPLFLTSKKLWVILDASLDPPFFFSRQKDRSLKHDIIGWSNEDDHLVFLPNIDDDDDEAENLILPYESFGSQMKVASQRQEVTYEKFLQLWPAINKPASGYHPSLVWTEIISFIKGSFEALHTEKGYLTEEEYIQIGKKRAPNFNGERNKVYQLFLRYIERKKQKQMFDESDVVFNLYKRLQKEDRSPCPLHEIYVDETQDFTQAELCLLIQLSEDPNQMFLTGDTAQSIMRGVSFRFSELQSLFYYAEKNAVTAKGAKTIYCPKSLYKLLHNYRSHQGILKLASSIIDILVRYFQDSFDPMEKDQGLFDGPKPKLLESCSLTDLSMLLRRDKRQTSHIEFGAHQVILVVNNESRDKLPEELSTALVLTIFEAKGLEFDDVLLYNFFQDSQASKEWRVVTKFLDELVNRPKMDDESYNQDSLIKINWDVFQEANRPRPLEFNSNQHKILNSELKLLYTALTRARVNLWIFDTDDNKRAPMFDYLKSLDLVQTINTNNLEDKEINQLIFAEESTPEMWLQRGDDLSRKSLYSLAAKCYNFGSHVQQEKLALANHHALTAQRCPDSQKKKENFLQAAQFYMECTQHIKAAKCLGLTKEKLFSAEIFEKCQEYESAGKTYLLLQKPLRASHCFERQQQFDRAVEILHDNKMYDQAINLIQKYNILVESYVKRGEVVPEVLIKHKPQKDFTYLCLRSADTHYNNRDFDKMKIVLNHLKSVEKMEFLEKKGLIDLAADMLFEENLLEQSVQLLRRNGKYEKSIGLARKANDDLLLASCLYTFAQHKYVKLKNADETTDVAALQRETTVLLEEAKTCYQRTADMNGRSLCYLLLSFVNNDKDSAVEALSSFLRISPHPNVAGGLQSANILVERVQINEIHETDNIIKVIGMGYKLLKDLKSTASTVSLPLRECLKHFGFHILNNRTVCIYPKLEPFVTIQLGPMMSITDSSSQYPITEIKQKLHQHLLNVIENLFLCVRKIYMLHLSQSIQCPFYTAGYMCQGVDKCFCPLRKIKLNCKRQDSICLHRHDPFTFDAFMDAINITKKLMIMDHDLICQVSQEDIALMKQLKNMMGDNVYKMSRLLLTLLTPAAGNALPFKTLSRFRLLKKFVSFPKCAVFVRSYLFATWKTVKSKSRRVSNFFLESKLLIGLFGLNISLERWVKELCWSTNYYTPNQGPGVLLFSDGFKFCVYERFVESLVYLHKKWNPFEALIKFTKYTTILMRKNIVFPSLDILLFWCEFFVVLALMLCLRNQKELVLSLPESYVINSFFVDCLQQNSTFSLQSAIEKSRPLHSGQMHTLLNRIEKLVGLLFHHSIVRIAEKEEHVKSGVTERYVVLGLLLLSNSSRGVSKHLVPQILDAISSIGISDIMAPRLKESLHKLRQVKGTLDVVLILTELLQRRGDILGQYRWLYDPKTSQGLRCDFLTSNAPSSSNSLKLDSTMEDENQDEEYYSDDEDEDGFTESEKFQAKEDSEKVKAVNIIKRAYRAYKFHSLWRQLAFNVSNSIARESGNQVDYFTDIKLTETSCNICGLSFALPSPFHSEMILEAALNEGEHSSHVEEDTSRKSEMEEHKSKSSHKENEFIFQRGVRKYRREFLPVLKKAQEVLSSHEQENLNPEIEFHFEQLTKSVTRLDEETSQMCKKASWRDFKSLQSLLDEVKTASAKLDKKLSIKQIESTNRNQTESSILEDKELEDFDDLQEIVKEPRSIRTQTLCKQGKRKR